MTPRLQSLLLQLLGAYILVRVVRRGVMGNDRVTRALFPNGEPGTKEEWAAFLDLYKIMVASSESLVARRQRTNTFFVAINGALVTGISLFLKGSGDVRPRALAIAVLLLVGIVLSVAWRSLILSFGQLNTGKFGIINRMESRLPAAIFEAEWEALERGTNPKVYRTFTSREIWIPVALGVMYTIAAVVSTLVAFGVLSRQTIGL